MKYQLVAYPAAPEKTGSPAYCSDESDVIRVAQQWLSRGLPDEPATTCRKAEITHPSK